MLKHPASGIAVLDQCRTGLRSSRGYLVKKRTGVRANHPALLKPFQDLLCHGMEHRVHLHCPDLGPCPRRTEREQPGPRAEVERPATPGVVPPVHCRPLQPGIYLTHLRLDGLPVGRFRAVSITMVKW